MTSTRVLYVYIDQKKFFYAQTKVLRKNVLGYYIHVLNRLKSCIYNRRTCLVAPLLVIIYMYNGTYVIIDNVHQTIIFISSR